MKKAEGSTESNNTLKERKERNEQQQKEKGVTKQVHHKENTRKEARNENGRAGENKPPEKMETEKPGKS